MERLPDGARLEKGPGGLERLVLSASDGEALVYLQGAHVAHFQPKGEKPVLWMSAESRFEAGKPIRGGVPICFPWFGPKAGAPDAPLHGFARILPWSIAAGHPRERRQPARDARPDVGRRRAGGLPARARPLPDREGRPEPAAWSWPCATPTPRRARSRRPCTATSRCRTSGRSASAASKAWPSSTRPRRWPASPATSEPITIAAETDRVYLGATGTVTIEDPGWRRRIVVGKSGSSTTVVWNPWIAKAKAMPDFGDDEWTRHGLRRDGERHGRRGDPRARRDPRHDRDARGAGRSDATACPGGTRSGHARAISS